MNTTEIPGGTSDVAETVDCIHAPQHTPDAESNTEINGRGRNVECREQGITDSEQVRGRVSKLTLKKKEIRKQKRARG